MLVFDNEGGIVPKNRMRQTEFKRSLSQFHFNEDWVYRFRLTFRRPEHPKRFS